MKQMQSAISRTGLSALAAILGVLSVTYNGIFAWFCFIPFFIAIQGLKPKSAAKYGALAGAIVSVLIFAGLYKYGVGIIAFITFYLIINIALFGYILGWIGEAAFKKKGVLFIPAIWVILEFCRTLSPISLPSNIAISQYNNFVLIQMASITGIYGISFFIVLVNCLLFSFTKTRKQKLVTCALGFLLISSTLFHLPANATPSVKKNSLNVSIIQGGIPLSMYRSVNKNPLAKEIIRKTYFQLTDKVKKKETDLIIWPEGVLGEYAMQDPALKKRLKSIPQRKAAFFVAGIPSMSDKEIHNSAYVFSPSGKVLGRYDKMHPIPFFEDYKPGKKSPVIDTTLGKLGIAICFESTYPGMVRNLVKNGAEIILILTNDAGFGKSTLVNLHAREAIFRAVETRRYVVRAAQSGISMFIDPMGKVLSETKEFEKTILTGSIEPLSGHTFYSRYGDVFVYLCIAGALIMLLLSRKEEPGGRQYENKNTS
ncbi:MAG: apolipoprotein N-acyltransferase [Omnitrophica bacterium]|nr:apolipoprotein N-acyltransferase [Candidatus Omnitrophota bacterium]